MLGLKRRDRSGPVVQQWSICLASKRPWVLFLAPQKKKGRKKERRWGKEGGRQRGRRVGRERERKEGKKAGRKEVREVRKNGGTEGGTGRRKETETLTGSLMTCGRNSRMSSIRFLNPN